ncbi:MAG TPA: DNA repair protein RadA [Sedimentibacter sp.]|jgi:DNA repair protein RadA/Sms|nr:DNA repair protein RadA [Sedimentibacter sp.]NLA13253.1 DNA repair protein RadA [Tissierellia bacterium]HAS92391.1 DNA repair protein RadA [Clostridiales bacterium]HOA19562.1 DNA repair protein RadA [Sedimentibacter sp.]HPB79324.1 DNA repair protein RadA [Sedimentibacter sp.]
MAKIKSKFVCQECGYETAKWLGKCPSCEEWNTFVEEFETKKSDSKSQRGISKGIIEKINKITSTKKERISTGSVEMDRVLGGGIIKSSLILVGGDPGIGKSTLLLQVADHAAKQKLKVLYVSGEESGEQIKIRADRLGIGDGELYVLAETNIDIIIEHVDKEEPDLLVLDSIQTIYSPDVPSAPGSVTQVREVTSMVMRITKTRNMASFIVGHVTKSGAIAGPRVLEHMVDTVLYFEGERHFSYRILRAVKNRFGSTNEIGIFEMRDRGLIEVENPSEVFLKGRPLDAYGTVVTAAMEGTRPVLIEIQALVTYSPVGFANRVTTGIDKNRASMLIAVLEKKAGLSIQSSDIFINVTGGLQIKEPACDLAILCALASSFKEIPVDFKTVLIGEVGLTGEIRGVNSIEKRLLEAKKMGFKRAVIAEANAEISKEVKNMEIIPVNNIRQVMDIIF